MAANNRTCPAGEEGGRRSPVSASPCSAAIDIRLIDNGVYGNKPGATTVGVQWRDRRASASSRLQAVHGHRRSAFNTALGNDAGPRSGTAQGDGNRFFANDCLTSQPDGLCEDPGRTVTATTVTTTITTAAITTTATAPTTSTSTQAQGQQAQEAQEQEALEARSDDD